LEISFESATFAYHGNVSCKRFSQSTSTLKFDKSSDFFKFVT
jgi:hypothetical protein